MGTKVKKRTTRAVSRKRTGLRSMTGFGKAAVKTSYGTVTAEIKTLNHKSLSINCNPLEGFFLLEERLKEVFEKRIVRGKVLVKISRDAEGKKKPLRQIRINRETAKEYVKKIKEIQKDLSLGGEIRIHDLMGFPGVIEKGAEENEEKLWPHIKKAAGNALKELIKYRRDEGSKLSEDFSKRIKDIQGKIQDIRKYEKQGIKKYRDKLMKMTQTVMARKEIDRAKLEEEVALFARNCDIAEELTRMEYHLGTFRQVLKTEKAEAGKKLDFIAQEMHRETNTIGAKASEYRISNAVIDIKSNIEKIREQLKNIE